MTPTMQDAMNQGSDGGNSEAGAEFEHWAFVSYSREDNRPTRGADPSRRYVLWGEWLHDALENYRVPKELVGTLNRYGEIIPERPFPVFRDEKDMGASGSIS